MKSLKKNRVAIYLYCQVRSLGIPEDVVLEIDRKTGETVKELDMKEIFDKTYRNKVDWAHLNTVSYKEDDHSVLLSPRNLHSAVKVDWDTKKIKWILANPEMFEGTEQEDLVLKPQGDIKWLSAAQCL